MNPFLTWFSENVGTLLILLAAVCLVLFLWGLLRLLKRREPRRGKGIAIAALALSVAGFALVGFVMSQIGGALFAQNALIGEPAPPLAFRSVSDDAPSTLEALRGQVVLVNLWATWCPPCREEMPDLELLQQELGTRGLAVVHVSDEARETLVAYSAEHPMTTRQVYVEGFPWPEWGRPTTFVVDREGRIRKVLVGPQSLAQFRDVVEPIL